VSAPASPTVPLGDGVDIPLVGLGTWQASGRAAYDAVRTALDVGYRHVDTATMYRNEADVGRAIRESGVPRDEVFVTTKLPSERADRPRETLDASLRDLGLDRVDLWLIHWPPGDRARPDVWEAFVAARDDGLARAIGVSNYSPRQIDELVRATDVMPALNQIRWSPALYDDETVQAHAERGVVLEGYSPFRAMRMRDRVLGGIATRHGVTPYQVVLRWHLEHGIVVIPKSADPARIAANFDVFGFALDADEVARIDALGQS
jgi:2,5-diketo-D-gluconate reductase A